MVLSSRAAPTFPDSAMTTAAASTLAPIKRGPRTPEGKARSSMNARRHGLRARTFGLLPGEEQAEWAEHLADLQAGYGPVDDTELKLVEAIAAAIWNEIRADRTLAEGMAAIPPLGPGRPHGGDLQEPRHALSLNTARPPPPWPASAPSAPSSPTAGPGVTA